MSDTTQALKDLAGALACFKRHNRAYAESAECSLGVVRRELVDGDERLAAIESYCDEIGARLHTLQSRLDRLETADSKPTPKPEGGKEGGGE